jgi:plasmid stabilization system
LKIITEKHAQQELIQIKWYIAQDSEFYANKTVNEINKRIENLLFFPEMGKVINEKRNIRQIIYKSYKILYKFDSENIYILHIIHHSRDISNLKI